MAKKKTKAKNGGSSQPAGEEGPALDRTESAQGPEEEEEEQAATDQQPGPPEDGPTQTVEDPQPQAASTECTADDAEALRNELAHMRQQLAAKDAEIEALRQQLANSSVAPEVDMASTAELEEMQRRLAALRQQQAEADAARDTAWRQLKSAVAEISKLADPSYLNSINMAVAK